MKLSIALLTIALPIVAFADTWHFEAKVTTEEFVFGETKIIKTVDSTQNQKYPDFMIDIYQNDDLQAKYRGISFQNIFAFKENTVFIGLSNEGIPGTAVVIFTDKGALNMEIKHRNGTFEYCTKSVTLERIWYEEVNPDLELVNAGEDNEEIIFTDCKGERVGLFSVLDIAFGKTTQ